ncbi:DgyrCDS3276 [Dimorphilus gyrociliatus]|uniref:DgyrCDS3276 n=1 Tax=Dimorphilus gyrociliatus TaxID=2664684 RepID=A0A7I8VCQ7_9ANNE|nr:DgyrCDS3276 [Dimorphilus gyrociliatus]
MSKNFVYDNVGFSNVMESQSPGLKRNETKWIANGAGRDRVKKPKTRKVIEGKTKAKDEFVYSMDSIEWSDLTFTAKDLIERGKLSAIVKVSDDCNPNGFPPGQIMQIVTSTEQDRIYAQDEMGNLISLPKSSALPISLEDGTSTTIADLVDSLHENKTPIAARINSSMISESRMLLHGKSLLLKYVKREKFLKGCLIEEAWVDQTRIVVIPIFLPIQFYVAEGMRGATPEEWHEYQLMYIRTIRRFVIKQADNFEDIFLHNESEDSERSDNYLIYSSLNDYTNWKPQEYYNISEFEKTNPSVPTLPPRDYSERVESAADVVDVIPDIIQETSVLTIETIPNDLSELSAGGVIDCLKLLNVDFDQFKRRKIDGAALLSLDDIKVLQTIFELSPLQAATLIRFIRGWRPQT